MEMKPYKIAMAFDKKRSLLNVGVSIFFKIVVLVIGLLAQRFLIRYLGNEYNGVNSLFVSVLNVLAVAELGVGSAITFCMYKPIVEGEKDKVSALYGLFTRLYLIIAAIILVAGLCVMPFIPYLASGYTSEANLYLTFFLALVATDLTYVFASRTSLINAYKNNYITTSITSIGQIAMYVAQIVVVVTTRSFVWFIAAKILSSLIQWALTEIVARRKHGEIIRNKQKLDLATRGEVVKNVKAMFMHKIGGVLVNTLDSIIISAFISVVILGKYSNYITIMNAMTGVISLFFSPLTSVIGHFCVSGDKVQIERYFNFFHTFNFMIGCIFFLGYYAIIDNLLTLCFEPGLELSRWTVFVIVLNYFIQYMRNAAMLFRDATGTFYYDRWKPLFEGTLNLGLSIGFVYLFRFAFGDDFAVVGVIVATIITNIFICHIIEPYVFYKHVLEKTTKWYWLKNYTYIVVFAGILLVSGYCFQSYDSEWLEFLVNGFIAVGIALVPCAGAACFDSDFRHFAKHHLGNIKAFFKRRLGKKEEEV